MTAATIADREAEFELTAKQIIAFAAIVTGVFLAMLDTQIVASSIGPLSVALGATIEEVAWIQSAYLIAEVIVIPLTAWLSSALSTRYLFIAAITGFTLMSIACASAWDLQSMIVFRLIQGVCGGIMIPVVMSSVYLIFPPSKQPTFVAFTGFIVMFSAISGPVVGGYITDLLSWHWLFLINVPFGIVVAVTVYFFVDFDKPNFSLLRKVDGPGILLIVLFLCSTEYVLKEGTKYDWFDSTMISRLTWLAVVSFLLFLYRELSTKDPVVDLRLFGQRNFAIACALSIMSGVVQFGSIYLIPAILSSVRDFNSIQIGSAMVTMGASMMFGAIAVNAMMQFFDKRVIMAFGLILATAGLWVDADLTTEVGSAQLFLGQVLRGFGLVCMMITITDIALGGLAEKDVRNGAGLYNLTRNLGGAFGLALITWLVQVRQDHHFHRLSEVMTEGRLSFDVARDWPAPPIGFDEHLPSLDRAQTAVVEMATNMAARESLVMAYNDVWIALTVSSLAVLVLIPFISKVEGGAPAGAAH